MNVARTEFKSCLRQHVSVRLLSLTEGEKVYYVLPQGVMDVTHVVLESDCEERYLRPGRRPF